MAGTADTNTEGRRAAQAAYVPSRVVAGVAARSAPEGESADVGGGKARTVLSGTWRASRSSAGAVSTARWRLVGRLSDELDRHRFGSRPRGCVGSEVEDDELW